MNKLQLSVFQSVLSILPSVTLCQGGYARTVNNKPTGLHSSDATAFDIASLLWQASESIIYPQENHELLFGECWRQLRQHFDWNRRTKNSDAQFCQFLDKHDKQWHIVVLSQIVRGEQYVQQATTHATIAATARNEKQQAKESKMQAIMEEYQ